MTSFQRAFRLNSTTISAETEYIDFRKFQSVWHDRNMLDVSLCTEDMTNYGNMFGGMSTVRPLYIA